MITMNCSDCPAGPGDCHDCVVAFLCGEKREVKADFDAPCDYVLTLETRAAIEVLRGAGLLSTVEIIGVEHAA